MTVSLTPEQHTWLSAHVARGDFASMEDGVRQLLDERIAERAAEAGDDLAWAKNFADEALADVAAGRVMARNQHEARMEAILASIKAG